MSGARFKITFAPAWMLSVMPVLLVDYCPSSPRFQEEYLFGFARPLCVNSLSTQGTYFVPLATAEALLVAQYSRGPTLY